VWPSNLSVAVFSAEYGLIGGLAQIYPYERRLSRADALGLVPSTKRTLLRWAVEHSKIMLWMGADYRAAIELAATNEIERKIEFFQGGIGEKLAGLRKYLVERSRLRVSHWKNTDRVYEYFLPDWDDTVDVDFNFRTDTFSAPKVSGRTQVHGTAYMSPTRVCDGILVSLAQQSGTKGLFRHAAATEKSSLYPEPIREKYGLAEDQLVFGDCGAFSYSSEETPPISPKQAAEAYQLYGVDLAASVDHIPVPEINVNGRKKRLSQAALKKRVQITQENAEEFILLSRSKRYSFEPVGVIQGLEPEDYGKQLKYYVSLGYVRVALGGLVPRGDTGILEILSAIDKARRELSPQKRSSLRIHLFGIYRPKIVKALQECGATSFDSASYLRKSWMRSDQNYLGVDNQWYTAIRVPCLSDKRNVNRLTEFHRSRIETAEEAEFEALAALHSFGQRRIGVDKTLKAVMRYYSMFDFDKFDVEYMEPLFRRTLESRIWERCDCKACKEIGVHVAVFRGYNRNIRRGMHNTALLYKGIRGAR